MTIQNNFPAIKPSLNLDFANTKQLDPRITFARASTARFYDGKTTAKAEENLVLYSQEFDNGVWTKASATVTANATTAPDGTTTADQVTITGSGLFLQQVAVVPGTTYTVSFYALAGTATTVNYLIFNVTASSTIVAPTNYVPLLNSSTWTRVSFSFTVPAGCTSIYVDLARASSNGTINLWGAQLEQRSFATAYTPTTSQPITNYIPVLQTAAAGAPRFDHNPVTGESLGLLIEEQRTNLLLQSETFDSVVWSKTNVSVLGNSAISPDGTLSADKILETTANAEHTLFQQPAYAWASGSKVCFSAYLKQGERRYAKLLVGGSLVGWNAYCAFDLQTGVSGTPSANSATATASMTDVGNGWYRCVVVATPSVSSTTVTIGSVYINNSLGANDSSYQGNGFSGIYAWGAQLEAGAFATSYIPTVASQVTRAADSASITGSNFSSWYTQGPGTLYIDLNSIGTTNSKFAGVFLYSSDNSALHSVANSGNNSAYTYTTGFALQVFLATTLTAPAKLAYAYETNNFAFASNGALVGVDGLGNLPILNKLLIGWNQVDNQGAASTIKKIAYYPQRLTNTQLQALTS